MSRFVVRFVTKADCPLCAAAEPLVERWAARTGAEVSTIDIAEDRELAARFSERVPVVLAEDGAVLTEGRISSARLGWAMIRAAARR